MSFLLPTDSEIENHPGSSCSGGASSVEVDIEDSESDKEHEEQDTLETYVLARDRQRRNIRPPSRFDDGDVAAYALVMSDLIEEEEPLTYGEAIRGRMKRSGKQPQMRR